MVWHFTSEQVLYFSLIPFVEIPFDIFIGVFIIAQVLGVFSQVPGGLGVFEGLFLLIMPGEHETLYLFSALIAYRIIYYLLPLIVSAIVLISYESYHKISRGRSIRRILSERMKLHKTETSNQEN